MKINILDKNLANMIAAGEVVERPASAVKELIENSVDANAKNITVEIKNGGMSYIRVTDDGDGIDKEDAVTAFARHATSKISTKEDLDKIYTLGFRGEALASIAAVARVDMFTKTKDAQFGVNVVVEGGEVIENSEVGCPDGTTMIIRNLFFNTPARMKFLKNDAAETTAVTDVVNKMILCHPGVCIKLISNGKTVVSSHGTGDVLDCVHVVYGSEYGDRMLPVNYKEEFVSVTGCTGAFSLVRKDRRRQVFFLNGRNIVNKTISTAVAEAYRNSIMVGKFPVCVLYINIAPGLVDVNVHPIKMEVRFSNEKKIYSAVYWAVKEALNATKHVPQIETEKVFTEPKDTMPTAYEETYQYELPIKPKRNDDVLEDKKQIKQAIFDALKTNNEKVQKQSVEQTYVRPLPKHTPPVLSFAQTFEGNEKPKEEVTPVSFERKEEPQTFEPTKEESPKAEPVNEEVLTNEEAEVKDFTLIGQVFDTYIIAESGDDMLLIDQHAAHERIWFEELMEQWQNDKISAQSLLIPVTVSLDNHDLLVAEENLSFFASVGFEIDIFGANDIIIRKVPMEMEDDVIADTVGEILNILSDGAQKPKYELYEKTLHTVACKKAIKGGKNLTEDDMRHLIGLVMELEGINTCPHGRPICVRMSKKSLEKQFKRIV